MALDEVTLLTLVADRRKLLLEHLPQGSSAAAAATAAAAMVADVAGAGCGGSDLSDAVSVAEEEAAAAAAAAGAECVVRYFGHSIHKGLRGSQVCYS